MRRSILIAALIALAVAGWLASPYLGLGGSDTPETPQAEAAIAESEAPAERLTAVRTRVSIAEPMARLVVLNGRTEADRSVLIAAETSGRLAELLKGLGPETTPEKRKAVEAFYWSLEEFKVSVFAQELGTAEKVSAKRLTKRFEEIRRMV